MRCERVAPVLMFAAAKTETNTKNVCNLFKHARLVTDKSGKPERPKKKRPTKMTPTLLYINVVKGMVSVFGLVCPMVGAASFFLGASITHTEDLNTRRSNAFIILHWQVPLESASFNSPVEKLF